MAKKGILSEYVHRFGNSSIEQVAARILVAMDYKIPDDDFANALGLPHYDSYSTPRSSEIAKAIQMLNNVNGTKCYFLATIIGTDPRAFYEEKKNKLRPEDASLLENAIDRIGKVEQDLKYGLIKRK